MTMFTTTLITAEEFLVLSTDKPCELVRGEVVEFEFSTMAHGAVCAQLGYFLSQWERQHQADVAITCNNSGIVLNRNPDTVRGPDLQVIPRGRLTDRRLPVGYLTIPPLIAIKVRDVWDRTSTLFERVVEFLEFGVNEAWIVCPKSKMVFIHRDNEETTVFQGSDILTSPQLPGFECPLHKLFEGIT